MIVSDVPGTTRDSVDTVLTWHKRQFRIVDTAGIRRPGRVAQSGQVESVSVLLARRSIEVGRRRRARRGRRGRGDRSGCRHRRRGGPPGQGRDHRRQQVGPHERARPGFREALRRAAAATAEVSRLRAHPARLGGHRGARPEAARGDRPRGGVAALAREDPPAEHARGEDCRDPPAPEPGAPARSHSLRGADQRGAAHVRVLHQRRHQLPLFVRALPGQPAARGVRLRGHVPSASRCARTPRRAAEHGQKP